ncbi:MAG: heme-binding protein [Xanthomonadales bacterium]|nr:heme-binding protein [Xanthomonadales bacterium]
MTRLIAFTTLVLGALVSGPVLAVEEARYDVLVEDGAFEVRRYAPAVVAVTEVEAEFENAGQRAFRSLAGYIGGENATDQDIAMTAPVTQHAADADGRWELAFFMPAEYALDELPAPENQRVQLERWPERTMAAVRYGGTWSTESYREHLAALQAWIAEQGLAIAGAPVWARYNGPFTPWFMRRNEVLIPIGPAPEVAAR